MTSRLTPVHRGAASALGALLSEGAVVGALLAVVAHSAVPAAVTGGGSTRSWWRRGDSLRADAQAARDAAAQAFYELDTAQRDARISVDTISAVEDSRQTQRTVGDFAALSQRIDEASHRYITAVDACDLDRAELDAGTVTQARRDLVRAREELERVKKDLDRFAESLAPLLAEAENKLARLVPAVERAKQALRAAANALDTVRGSGLSADDLASRLAALGPELTRLNQGAAVHGVRGTLHRAEEVVHKAEQIRSAAERLPERAKELDRRLVSLRTRVEAVANRVPGVEPVLSELRRRFALACWQDLQPLPGEVQRAAVQAREKLREAEQARTEQRWADATALLGTVRALLDDADDALSAVHNRLRALNEAERDPRSEIERTRFALRDAQRLAMAGRSQPDPRHAAPLDAAVARIDRVVEQLNSRHPDYWRFLNEMAEIRETAGQVVAAIREERAANRR